MLYIITYWEYSMSGGGGGGVGGLNIRGGDSCPRLRPLALL